MFFYIAIWLVLLLCSLKRNNKLLMWGNIVVLSLIAGLRDVTIGVDTQTYYELFGWIAEGNGQFIEPGWYFLNRFVQILGGGFNLFLWLVALLTLVPIGILSQWYSPNPSLSLFFYYSVYAYLNSFNIMRQILSVSFVFLAYCYLNRQQLKMFLLFIICAALFHISALFAFPLVFIKYFTTSKVKVVVILLISLIASFVFNNTVFSFLLGPYAHYLEGDFGYRDSLFSVYLQGILLNIFFILIFLTSQLKDQNSLWLKIFFVGIVLMNITLQLQLGSRLILYFTLIQIIVYPQYLLNNRIKNKKILYSLIILYSGIIFMKILILGNPIENSIYPYKSILF